METQAGTAQDEFDARLEVLRRRYMAGLPARRTALAEAWFACGDGGGEAPWERLREVAHNLSGSASNYGLEALGKVARQLDRQLSGRTPCRARAQVQAQVERLLGTLDAAIGAA